MVNERGASDETGCGRVASSARAGVQPSGAVDRESGRMHGYGIVCGAVRSRSEICGRFAIDCALNSSPIKRTAGCSVCPSGLSLSTYTHTSASAPTRSGSRLLHPSHSHPSLALHTLPVPAVGVCRCVRGLRCGRAHVRRDETSCAVIVECGDVLHGLWTSVGSRSCAVMRSLTHFMRLNIDRLQRQTKTDVFLWSIGL